MNRDDFPMLDSDISFFDNGATTLKPKCVIDSIVEYYSKHTSNIHRGDYDASVITNKLYDETRDVVCNFINANSPKEIVFTSGTTESINMVVFGYMKKHLKKGDEILLSKSEHASNVLPWIKLSEEIGTVIKYIPLNEEYELTVDNLLKTISSKTKVISIAHVTNVIGDVRDIEEIGKICKDKDILFNVDGAQSVPHMKVDFKKSNIDFLSFSAHKMLGPTGVGVLVGKYNLLEDMDPIKFGGGMNQFFEEDNSYELKNAPVKFEAGTPNIAGVIGMKKAIEYLESIGMDKIHNYEMDLKKYMVEELEKIPNLVLYNKNSNSGILAFNIKDVFSQDSSIYLNHYNIYVRAGNHCTKMLKDEINIRNTVRVSMYLYNDKNDVDKLIKVLKQSKDIFKVII
ncbi:MAG: cysteine desulfurase [Bacilli bacterium]|nr:cysteine desulfurase [Bacilli bacterium]